MASTTELLSEQSRYAYMTSVDDHESDESDFKHGVAVFDLQWESAVEIQNIRDAYERQAECDKQRRKQEMIDLEQYLAADKARHELEMQRRREQILEEFQSRVVKTYLLERVDQSPFFRIIAEQ